MRIQIIDIGNTHTKFADFEVDKGRVDLKDFEQVSTPRQEPHDLFRLVANGVRASDVLMVNSFSGAFIYKDQWYFADKDVAPFVDESQFGEFHECEYVDTGQNHRFGLIGFPAL